MELERVTNRGRFFHWRADRGQGLVEFALILTLLLMFIMGILDFGRAFLIYTSLFNAAREGARWGAVNPWNPNGIINRTLQYVALVNPADVSVTVQCDKGPGTSTFNCLGPGGSGPGGKAGIGERVIVSVNYNLQLISPLISAFAPTGLPVQAVARRTIASYGEAYLPPPPGGGGSSEVSCTDGVDNDGDDAVDCADSDCQNSPGCLTSEDCTNYVDDDRDGRVDCDDPDCSDYPGCLPQPEICNSGRDEDRDGFVDCYDPDCEGDPNCASLEICYNGTDDDENGLVDCADPHCSSYPECVVVLNKPLCAGATQVTGIAQRGQTVQLRNVNTGYIATTVAGANSTFAFTVPALQIGHLVLVQAYGKTDYDVVMDCSVTPTPSPTPSPTPAPTPTPTSGYITISPTCGGPGTGITITVRGHNWVYKNPADYTDIYWNSTRIVSGARFTSTDGVIFSWTTVITVSVTAGQHTVRAENKLGGSSTASFVSPCPISGPNLVVSNLRLLATPPITTHRPITYQAVVRNIGNRPVNSLFWVDLYANASPTTTPPFSGASPIGWSAVSGLGVSGTITLTISTSGFAVTGTHRVYAWADSWRQVAETSETDNITGPITVSVGAVGPTPTPTPTPSPTRGVIVGTTYLLRGGTITPISRATVEVRQGSTLIASTQSGANGDYVIMDIPEGTYTVVGWILLDGRYYTYQETNVVVVGGQITRVNLYLWSP